MGPSSLCRFCRGCIIAMPGYDFREGQVRSRLAEESIFADGGLRRQGEPFGQRTRAPTFVFFAGDEMAFLVEMIVDLGMN
jgi:hypothetical protein